MVSLLRVCDLAQKFPGALLLRVCKELAGGCLLHHYAVLHENGLGGNIAGKAHLVGDHQHGHAYCAETMRGALESVPQGQLEAGYCVGMSWWQIMRRIVLPQALRTAVPALSNSLIGMIKDTSLASNITVAELFMAGQRVAARTYIFLPIYCEVAVVYLLFCTVITKLQGLLERQLNAHGFQ